MKKKIFVFLLLLFVFTASSAAASETFDISVTGVCDYDAAYEILEIINAERASEGLEPVYMNRTLLEAAMQRAAEITFYYDRNHLRPDGSQCFTVIEGFNAKATGENIAAGQSSPEKVMTDWMNSDGHRANIMSDLYSTVGIGCFYQEEYGFYAWTQIFSSSADGGYECSGKVKRSMGITVRKECYDSLIYYNPAISSDAFYAYKFICPGRTYEYRLMNMHNGIGCILDEDTYTYKTDGEIISSSGKFITGLKEGVGECEVYVNGIYVSSVDITVKHHFTSNDSAPTCTLPGTDGGGICAVCGFERAGITLPALGHDEVILPAVEPTCEEWGWTEGSYCRRCGITLKAREQVENLGHIYVSTEIPPTCTEYGKVCVTCERCSYYQEFQSQSPLGHWWGDPCDDEDNYDRVTVCETCEYKEVYKKGYERLNSDVKSFMDNELKPTHEETVMKYKAIYDKFSDEYKAEFLYEEELNELLRYFEFFHMGDADRNGKIGAEDLSVLLSWYGGQYYMYDIVGNDEIINSDDLSVMLGNYGKVR